MSQHDDAINNGSPARQDGTPIDAASQGQLVRAAADGELPTDLSSAFDAVPDAQARRRFEQQLRASVQRTMGSAAAPAELRDRIAAAMAAESVEPAEQSTVGGPATRDRAFWTRSWQPALALAATLILTVSLVLLGARGSADQPQPNNQLAANGTPNTAAIPASDRPDIAEDRLFQLVHFTNASQKKCLGPDGEKMLVVRSEQAAIQAAVELLDRIPSVMDLRMDSLADLGYEFAGMGRCQIPGDGTSVHLVYRSSDNPDLAPVSLFIQKDMAENTLQDVDDGTTVYISGNPCPLGSEKRVNVCTDPKDCHLLMWRDAGFLYYLYTPDPNSLDKARERFGAPERSVVL